MFLAAKRSSTDKFLGFLRAWNSSLLLAPGIPTRRPGPRSTVSSAEGTMREFADQIRRFAGRKAEVHLFSGEHFESLSKLFQTASEPCPGSAFPFGSTSTLGLPTAVPEFPPVHLVTNGVNSSPESNGSNASADRPRSGMSSVAVSVQDDLKDILAQHAPTDNSGLLVFLCGWQSPAWLRILGAECGIDPEMMRRHLRFLTPERKFYDQPPLPSHQLDNWQIRTVTICELTSNALNPDEVKRCREGADGDVRKYLLGFRSGSRVGSSIIRRYSVIDEKTLVIEQDISFCATARRDGGWVGTIWTDSGIPFDCLETLELKVPSGASVRGRNERYIPLVLHRPKIAISRPEPPLPAAPPAPSTPPCPLLFHLPSQYGSTLDSDLARVDALYAFSEIISIAASSENKLLNLLQERIDIGLRAFHGVEESSLENLQYLATLLQGIHERSEEVVCLIENEAYSKWPSAAAATVQAQAQGQGQARTDHEQQRQAQMREMTRKLLLDDYRFILRRAKSLKGVVREVIATITAEVMTQNAKRSNKLSRKVGRITVLAYFFLPLSFVTSIYGMNFVSFGEAMSGFPWKGVAAFSGTLLAVFLLSVVMFFLG
ncbi:hypothetical protein B0T25DRAFT_599349 [Lasiosphaeria hispida]|uniref:Uncharacterized protein n=1 Tax=Lasiosphaeria hispida TaxID=260671 RepID=A0AAJ0M7K2_9PEZI|nr:hypothetical protein B0T25DRAFT_599349 [Lasiosphaeria hispida]